MRLDKQSTPTLLALLVCAVLQLQGCAPVYEATMTSSKKSRVCCKSMDAFDYESMEIGQSKKIRIDEGSPTFSFDSGESRFKAYRLPASARSYHVKLESHPVDSMAGPLDYLFHPVLMTLDENFNIVQISDSRQFQPINTFSSVFTGWKFRLRGQLPITKENNEKYLVVLTTDELMRKNTVFEPRPSCYYCKTWTVKHAPHGRLTISLVWPEDLNREKQEEWRKTYDPVRADDRYAGHGFSLIPSRLHDYRFKDLSGSDPASVVSYLNFARFTGGESAVAFVKSISLTDLYMTMDADGKLTKLVSLARKHHEENLYIEKYEVSSVRIDGADCRRVDFYGKSKYEYLLPMRGYDIACLHPERAGLVIRIGAAYVYPLGESTTTLPVELSEFYRWLQFKGPSVE